MNEPTPDPENGIQTPLVTSQPTIDIAAMDLRLRVPSQPKFPDGYRFSHCAVDGRYELGLPFVAEGFAVLQRRFEDAVGECLRLLVFAVSDDGSTMLVSECWVGKAEWSVWRPV